MLGHTYDREVCSAARALEVAGERWSLLILRNAAFGGMTRFSEFASSLEIAPNILTARLQRFVDEGLMKSVEGPAGNREYHLTEKGIDFKPVIVALTQWGDRWAAPDGPPIVYEHAECGGRIRRGVKCEKCGATVKPRDILARKTPVMAQLQARRARTTRSKRRAIR